MSLAATSVAFNIDTYPLGQVLERGERIELLVHKTDALQGQAFSFRRETRRLRNQIWSVRPSTSVLCRVF